MLCRSVQEGPSWCDTMGQHDARATLHLQKVALSRALDMNELKLAASSRELELLGENKRLCEELMKAQARAVEALEGAAKAHDRTAKAWEETKRACEENVRLAGERCCTQ